MPPILRRASFYDRMKDLPQQQFDSFGEDDSKSDNSSASNYSHQDYNTVQIQAIKQMGLLDPNTDDTQKGKLGIFELSQAKPSDIPVEPPFLRDKDYEKELKLQVLRRRGLIIEWIKQRKCRKLVSIIFFVLAISIYLAVNTIYTYTVFKYEA